MKNEITVDETRNKMLAEERDSEYESLLQNVGDALSKGRQRVASYIGTQTVRTYLQDCLSCRHIAKEIPNQLEWYWVHIKRN